MTRVLYYDPDPVWREAVARSSANTDGLEFAIIATFEEAIADLHAETPDAVVVDPPYEEGTPLLSIARQRCGAVPFVLIMPAGKERAAIELLNGGADRYMEKSDPIDPTLTALANILRSILDERSDVKVHERRAEQLEFLSRTAMDFVRMGDNIDLYEYIAERVRECAPDAWVSVSSFDSVSGLFTVRAFAGSDHDRRVFAEELPRPMVGTCFSMEATPTATVVLSCRTLNEAPSSFSLLSARTVPEEICARIDELIPPGRAYAMSFTCRGGVYGVVTLRLPPGMELENRELIGAFIRQASVALLRRHARQRLLASEERYRTVVEGQQELICRFSPDGTHQVVNEAYCRFFGLDPGAVVGRRFLPVVPAEEQGALMRHFEGFSQSSSEGAIEHRVRCPDGRLRWLQWHDRAFFDSDGIITEFQSIGRDVTERKEAEDALAALTAELEQRIEAATADLRAANRDLESFSHLVSHDLRTPLRAIDGYLGILMARFGPELPPDAIAYVGRAREGVHRADRFLEGLLSLSRLSRQPLQYETVDTEALVRAVLSELILDPGERPIEVVVGSLPPCRADREMLRHVYQNLIGNALKFTRGRDPVRIEIRAGMDGSKTVYTVSDNGIGFRSEDAARTFDDFARLHGAREFEGSGIGLALVRRIVERHGGRCWAEGEVGRGAAFSFTLGGSSPFSEPE